MYCIPIGYVIIANNLIIVARCNIEFNFNDYNAIQC